MKCQKCQKSAVVHLTEILSDEEGMRHQVEIHLCLAHAVEAGFVSPETQITPSPGNLETPKNLTIIKPKTPAAPPQAADTGLPTDKPTAIVPSQPAPTGLSLSRKAAQPPAPADPNACPVCGMTWTLFKQHGVMGCPNDYTFFESKLLPIVRRTQENASEHAGKLPTRVRDTGPAQAVTLARLRRELQQAIDTENYEQAAKLRDQLRTMEEH